MCKILNRLGSVCARNCLEVISHSMLLLLLLLLAIIRFYSELGPHDTIHLAEFERLTQEGFDSLEFRRLNDEDMMVSDEIEWY